MTDCPECDRPLRNGRCSCGWITPVRQVHVPRVESTRCAPTAAQREILHSFANRHVTKGPYWTVDRIRNQAQVDHIIRQANHFGPMSIAGRFYADCLTAGAIADCKFVHSSRRPTPMREPGEDSAEDIGEAA